MPLILIILSPGSKPSSSPIEPASIYAISAALGKEGMLGKLFCEEFILSEDSTHTEANSIEHYFEPRTEYQKSMPVPKINL